MRPGSSMPKHRSASSARCDFEQRQPPAPRWSAAPRWRRTGVVGDRCCPLPCSPAVAPSRGGCAANVHARLRCSVRPPPGRDGGGPVIQAARRPVARTTRLRKGRNRSLQRPVQAPVITTTRWLGPGAQRLLAAVGLVFVSTSCGVHPAATIPAQQSGSTALIFGVVEASPGCPVERQDHACKPRLLGAVRVEARPLPAGVTATTRTRADGQYSFRLARGRYVLVAATGQVVSRCPHVVVSVTSPAPVRADIDCDSGIR